jgi:ATP-dependent helicase/nuclease subunit A
MNSEENNLEKHSLKAARRKYIKTIADKISGLIAGGAKPGDIMVLVQRRAPFATPLVNELKKRGIAVAGSDRIILPEFPAVRDLLNLARWCIDSTDDYSLACALKSPLFRFSEKSLHELFANREIGRGGFSIISEKFPDEHAQLLQILEWSEILAPYSFFMRVLNTEGRREKMIAALGSQIVEPLEEFLTICLSYERTQPGGLRSFIKWFIEGGSEIKRELSASDGVRVATVHSSKGLEAPIVFLIDTIRTPRDKQDKIVPIAPCESVRAKSVGKDGWLWSPKSTASEKWKSAAESALQVRMAEYWRLLYVAMTRARDGLYIYGFCAAKNPPGDAWHTKLWEILREMPGAEANCETITMSN